MAAPFDAHVQSEDQHRVQNDIGQRPRDQGDHAQEGIAHRLQQPLTQSLQKHTQAENRADPQIPLAHSKGGFTAAARVNIQEALTITTNI